MLYIFTKQPIYMVLLNMIQPLGKIIISTVENYSEFITL
jgi:hypothetical protein